MSHRLATPLLASSLLTGVPLAAAWPVAAQAEGPDTPAPGLHALSVAVPAALGPPKEVSVLADLPTVKIVAITLRGGTTLPEHKAAVPVTIAVAHGAATLHVAGSTAPLRAGSFVVLDANTVHAVVPDNADPVTVLVHHHKGAGQ
jgi:quercetin dioxygenase-like cupin family protein